MYLCDLGIHRIGEERQKGRQTACEAACLARAIHVGTTDEISALTGEKAAKKSQPREIERGKYYEDAYLETIRGG
jgi:Fe-S-cluster-containing dehydrogenase component